MGKIMRIDILETEKKELERRHKKERDKRVADRIKAVLLNAKGWSQKQIAEALLINIDTVHDHLTSYVKEQSLKPSNGGSFSKLNYIQTQSLICHLEYNT